MGTVLHLDASARGGRSKSRRLGDELLEHWLAAHPGDAVVRRDVGRDPVPHVTEAWIAAAFTEPERRTPQMREVLRISDELVNELLAADVILLATPMYNFGVPSALKSYIDQIVRAGRTFGFDPSNRANPYTPLVHGKRMFVVAARGDAGYEPGQVNAHMNHLDPHLRTVFGYIGITDLTFVHTDADEFGGSEQEQSIRRARRALADLVGPPVAVSG